MTTPAPMAEAGGRAREPHEHHPVLALQGLRVGRRQPCFQVDGLVELLVPVVERRLQWQHLCEPVGLGKAAERAKVRGKFAWLDAFFEYLSNSFRPLLGERMEVIVPPQHYDKVDF